MATIRKRQIISLFLLTILALGTCSGELPKPGYTRTMLKVSRSLPGETEELKVRTSEGNIATLIVKRRDKSSSVDETMKLAPTKLAQEDSNRVTAENKSEASASVQADSKLENETKKKNEARRLEEAQVEEIRATFSKASLESRDEKSNVNRTTDKERESSEGNQPVSSSPIDHGHWTPLDADGRALKLEEPEEEEEYRSWKPLRTDPKTATEEIYGRFSETGEAVGGILFARNFQDRAEKKHESEDEKNERALYYNTYVPHVRSRPSARTNIGANLSKNRDGKAVPPEVTVRSEINVKPVPKRLPMSLDIDGTPVVHGARVSDDPIDKVQTWRNARVINNMLITRGGGAQPSESYFDDNAEKRQRFDKFFKDVNRRYGRNYDDDDDGEGRNVYLEWDPRNYKNEALKAEVYDHYRASVHKRMLHPDGIADYPISRRYTPDSQTIAPVALKPGARAPVLQYAHPELGVQPAKILKNEKRRPDNFPENQHSFTEHRHKKKYVLNDKNIVDSYTTKNYYPNQHFYGLKRPNDPPFWIKISENLRNRFSTGVERVSQFTRPVIDPLVEATHKISQNLGLSQGKEAQDKIGTVASGTSILIPALGLVASGAALGIGAVAVGRYLDVDVLKRSHADHIDAEHKRALADADAYLKTVGHENSYEATPRTLYVLRDTPPPDNEAADERASSENDGVFLILEKDKRNSAERIENRETRQTGGRKRRSLDYSSVFRTETDMKDLRYNKRFQRKGADSMSEIVEIDLPTGDSSDRAEFLIPEKKDKKKNWNKNAILVLEDGSKILPENLAVDVSDWNALENSAKIGDIVDNTQNRVSMKENGSWRRKRNSVENSENQELLDALQNLENAEVAEVAHIEGDWTNTPCAKRIFCEAMIQRGADAAVLMEKKMAALLRLIQSGAAVQVSSHFEEVMSAVRRHDCSSFLCPQARPGNVFF